MITEDFFEIDHRILFIIMKNFSRSMLVLVLGA